MDGWDMHDAKREGQHMRSIHVLIAAVMVGLMGVACSTAEGVNLTTALSGEEAICEGATCGGNATATARIEIDADGSKLCYRYDIGDLVERGEQLTTAHIHFAKKGAVGPVVVDLLAGNEGCTDVVSKSTLRDLSENPASFYVDVHSERYPEGAARGQLQIER